MEIKINSLIPCSNQLKFVEIFGYTSKGTPGLEVAGLGAKGRHLKEKLIYLSKRRNLKFPILRYVICINGEELSRFDLSWLELPMLLAFWSMTKTLSMKRLDNCLASAAVSLEGEINYLKLDPSFWLNMNKMLTRKNKQMIYIGNDEPVNYSQIYHLDSLEILNDEIGGFTHIDNEFANSMYLGK